MRRALIVAVLGLLPVQARAEQDVPAPSSKSNAEICEGFHADEAAALAAFVSNGKDLEGLKTVLEAEQSEHCISAATARAILDVALFVRADIDRSHKRRRR
jgi:hypothetical protein